VLAAGRNVVLDIEVEGARQVRQSYPDSVHVFLLPPSAESLAERLRGRRTEAGDAVRRRLEIADRELAGAAGYDYVIVNDELNHAVSLVSAVIDAESRRPTRWPELETTIERLRRRLSSTR
jgi:guanylate kinase